jgi:hypothetical protein
MIDCVQTARLMTEVKTCGAAMKLSSGSLT